MLPRFRATPPRRGRAVVSGLALIASVALLTSCSALAGLIDAVQPQQTVSEVVGDDFASQTPEWRPCGGSGENMQCARVQAPIDWADPGGDRIELALVKQPALSGVPVGTLFVNPGGPGASGVSYIAGSIDYAVGEPLQQHYDVIGW